MLNEENYFVDNAELTGTDCYSCHKEIKGSSGEGKPRICTKCYVSRFIQETQEKPIRKLKETDEKKDLEWLVQRIHSEQEYLAQSFAEGKETDAESAFNDGKDKALSNVMRLIEQLDEPEVLSQEWVEEHTWNNHYIGRPFVYVDDLQEVLVPKQEDQKYYVIDNHKVYLLAKEEERNKVETVAELIEFYGHEHVELDYQLTEQEIKDYDERYWAFRKPVEEIEE